MLMNARKYAGLKLQAIRTQQNCLKTTADSRRADLTCSYYLLTFPVGFVSREKGMVATRRPRPTDRCAQRTDSPRSLSTGRSESILCISAFPPHISNGFGSTRYCMLSCTWEVVRAKRGPSGYGIGYLKLEVVIKFFWGEGHRLSYFYLYLLTRG